MFIETIQFAADRRHKQLLFDEKRRRFDVAEIALPLVPGVPDIEGNQAHLVMREGNKDDVVVHERRPGDRRPKIGRPDSFACGDVHQLQFAGERP